MSHKVEQPCINPVSRPNFLTHDPGNTTLLERREVAVVNSLVASGYTYAVRHSKDRKAISLFIHTNLTPLPNSWSAVTVIQRN